MFSLIVNKKNINYLKTCFRQKYPLIKSSYRAEAIAGALGFKSSIALNTTMRSSHNLLLRFESERFNDRLCELSGCKCEPVHLDEIRNDFPDKIWLLTRKIERNSRDQWFFECRERGIPTIHIIKRHKYFMVDYDYISIKSKYDEYLFDVLSVNQMYEAFCQCANSSQKAHFQGSSVCGQADFLFETEAKQLADKYFEIFYTAIKKVKNNIV